MPAYPFTAIVGQAAMKRALTVGAVNPAVGGVLLRGERGTAKSTAVRALAEVLPSVPAVADCRFRCSPADPERMCRRCRSRHETDEQLPVDDHRMRVVDLPLNASEDRVVGTIDLEQAVKEGERAFEPGILAEANRNVLYVDEVNLLDDHIVDVLLDAAAMGENVVEREGVSYRHPAEFILVGTMNPEEGDLRPQLLDRFDVLVDVSGSDDPEERIEVARRRAAFDADPEGFRADYADDQAALRDRIAAARDRLSAVTVSEEVLSETSLKAVRQRAAGVRADIAVARIGRAIAALEDEPEMTRSHAREAQYFAFPHRVEGVPEMDFGQGVLSSQADEEDSEDGDDTEDSDADDNDAAGEAAGMPIAEEDSSYPVDRTAIAPDRDRLMRERLGRKTPSKVDVSSGRYVRATDHEEVDDVALDATIRAAAPHQTRREGSGDRQLRIEPRDLKQRIRERNAETLFVFVVDASGSVMSGRQMLETKRGILSLLEDAYRTRDRVAVIVFRGEGSFTLAEPTYNVSDVRRRVSTLHVGGNTPLAHGLVEAYQLVDREWRRNEELYPLAVVFSDGQSNVEYREDGDPREDALEAAALFADDDIPAVWVNTGYRIDETPDEIWTPKKAERMKRKRVEKNLTLAETMDADYLPLVTLPRNTSLPDELEVTAK
jgi:magnesium chelatase subunit D